MSKKRYFILSPTYSNDSEISELRIKAGSYYGKGNYEELITDPLVHDAIRKSIPNGSSEYNASLLLIGTVLMAIAQSDSVYVAKEWETDDVCRICHAIAFSHGVDMIYESV